MNTWPYQSKIAFAAMPDAAYWTRRHLENVLSNWRCTQFIPNAKLVATELVTNAVKHSNDDVSSGHLGRSTDGTLQMRHAYPPERVALIQVRVSHGNGRLLLEVWDRSERAPTEQLPDFASENERGLFVVSAFCEQWGWCLANGGGKIVWAVLER
ncbi:ATP-binding protein [Actinomadura sp. 3N508]|uniref:ATP-binding protein n=1 Tax=Actinomadura sp. 3N508 TaxID=3375153 RepID=UPI0037B71E5B